MMSGSSTARSAPTTQRAARAADERQVSGTRRAPPRRELVGELGVVLAAVGAIGDDALEGVRMGLPTSQSLQQAKRTVPRGSPPRSSAAIRLRSRGSVRRALAPVRSSWRSCHRARHVGSPAARHLAIPRLRAQRDVANTRRPELRAARRCAHSSADATCRGQALTGAVVRTAWYSCAYASTLLRAIAA